MNRFFTLLILTLTVAFSLHAQDTTFSQIKKTITLGFQAGTQLNYCAPYQNNKIGKYQYTNRLLARKKITHHFDVETGINYAVIPMGNTITPLPFTSRLKNQGSQLSIPLTIQYNFLPETKRLRPYISAGAIYDIIKISAPPATKPAYTDGAIPAMQSNKGIGAVVTQGVIYEINTKIEFNENIHFIQQNNCKCIGFDLGIGYKL
jgi:outer membrane protein W